MSVIYTSCNGPLVTDQERAPHVTMAMRYTLRKHHIAQNSTSLIRTYYQTNIQHVMLAVGVISSHTEGVVMAGK
jgi:hypothetical protein